MSSQQFQERFKGRTLQISKQGVLSSLGLVPASTSKLHSKDLFSKKNDSRQTSLTSSKKRFFANNGAISIDVNIFKGIDNPYTMLNNTKSSHAISSAQSSLKLFSSQQPLTKKPTSTEPPLFFDSISQLLQEVENPRQQQQRQNWTENDINIAPLSFIDSFNSPPSMSIPTNNTQKLYQTPNKGIDKYLMKGNTEKSDQQEQHKIVSTFIYNPYTIHALTNNRQEKVDSIPTEQSVKGRVSSYEEAERFYQSILTPEVSQQQIQSIVPFKKQTNDTKSNNLELTGNSEKSRFSHNIASDSVSNASLNKNQKPSRSHPSSRSLSTNSSKFALEMRGKVAERSSNNNHNSSYINYAGQHPSFMKNPSNQRLKQQQQSRKQQENSEGGPTIEEDEKAHLSFLNRIDKIHTRMY